MLARNISRELKYKRVNWRRRRWKTIITKICVKIFARNISRELKYKRVNWRRRRWKTIITKFVIKCARNISRELKGHFKKKLQLITLWYIIWYIKGTEIQKSQLKAKKVKNHNYKICDKMFARNISRELKYKRVNWRRRRWKTIITKICDKMFARNISRELKYKRVNWRRRRWKTIITKICDKIFAKICDKMT